MPNPHCRSHADQYGDHNPSCTMGNEGIANHNHLRDAIHKTTVQADLALCSEVGGLQPGPNNKPMDTFLPTWSNWKGTSLDITVSNSLQTATRARCAVNGAHTVEVAHNAKVHIYDARCTLVGLFFLPPVVDTFGEWHP